MLCSENTPHYELKNSKYRGHFSSHQEYFDVGFFFLSLTYQQLLLNLLEAFTVQFVIITKNVPTCTKLCAILLKTNNTIFP